MVVVFFVSYTYFAELELACEKSRGGRCFVALGAGEVETVVGCKGECS